MSTPLFDIPGVQFISLEMHQDDRGVFTEIFRHEWKTGISPVQWNCVHSKAGVLRGVHVHRQHADYLTVAHGRVSIGLQDLRQNSPTNSEACVATLESGQMGGIVIPPGVAHGFFFHEPSVHFYAVTDYWNDDDELGCRWDDPELKIPWDLCQPHISQRDNALPPLGEILPLMPEYVEVSPCSRAA